MSSKLLQALVDCTWGGAELVVVGVPQTEQGVVHLGQVAVAQALRAQLSPELDNVLKYCVSQYVKCMNVYASPQVVHHHQLLMR